ncbi:MarR family winged helix-turn-helix transcriptional regulator [Xanthobacter pseudotagetidis]|uniref:MarR family winged helix-turn-helix transcriptional regulator n=1 Tax=Xanthobacter pseudotagetidis TaxID=3119911 RepID=UPI0037262384
MPVSDLSAHLGYWLRFVSNHVSLAFARKVEGHGVTVAEWVLLRVLHGEPPTAPSRLADRLGLTRGAVSKLADRLLAKGLIVRAASESDRRAHTLALTPEGAALVPVLAALADENDAEFFAGLTPQERAVIAGALRRIVETRGLRAVPVD